MPLYEYSCKDCGVEFEEVVPFAQADAVVCSACGSASIERLASSIASAKKTAGSDSPGAACSLGG